MIRDRCQFSGANSPSRIERHGRPSGSPKRIIRNLKRSDAEIEDASRMLDIREELIGAHFYRES